MTKRCESCGRFIEDNGDDYCKPCWEAGCKATIVALEPHKIRPQTNILQEDKMKHGVKPGETWSYHTLGREYLILAPHPDEEGLWATVGPNGLQWLNIGQRPESYKLIKDEHGDPVEEEAKEPGEVETAISGTVNGDVTMKAYAPPGVHAWGVSARQGAGSHGYTCVGFRFKETSRKGIWPHPILWKSTKTFSVGPVQAESDDVPVIAELAIWKKLGS